MTSAAVHMRAVPSGRKLTSSVASVLEAVPFLPLGIFKCNRANGVKVKNRLSKAFFGSPNAKRANGIREKDLECANAKDGASGTDRVFEIDRKGSRKSEKLPTIWLTEAMHDESSSAVKSRKFVTCYPNGADKGGWNALEAAERYFAEGTSTDSECPDNLRIQCIQAAEILYLHAIHRGNVSALTRLATIYRYDMCRGSYWSEKKFLSATHASKNHFESRASDLYRKAASLGSAEAMWNLGDMVKSGKGAWENKKLALALYFRAFETAGCIKQDKATKTIFSEKLLAEALKRTCNILDMGRAALRIAECYEHGWGCVVSIEIAKRWYKVALIVLTETFAQGQWYVKRDKVKAEKGLARMRQEICGCY